MISRPTFARARARASAGVAVRAFALACAATVALPGGRLAAQGVRADTVRIAIADAVDYVLRSSDENKLALLAVDNADAAVTTARATGLPQLRFNGSYNQVLKNARAEIVGSVFGQAYTYTNTFALSQTLFQGGKIVSATRAADATRQGVRFDAGETRARLAVDIQRSYLNALYLARIAELQDQNLKLSSDRLAQVEQLFTAGRSARFDVLRARVDRANIEPLAIQAHSDRDVALLDVKRLLDIEADRPLVLTTALDTTMVRQVVNRVREDKLADEIRGSVRSAELSLRARQEGIKVARGDYLPTVTATFNWGYLALPSVNGFPDRLGATSLAFCPAGTTGKVCQNNGFFPDRNFTISMTWAAFDGLRTKGNVDLARAAAKIAETALHQVREATSLELARARAEFERAQLAYNARTVNAAEAQEAFELATLRFSRGLSTQVEVSDSQLALLTAKSTEARSTYDLYLAAADLARVRGRPIPLPTGGSVPVRSNSGLSSAPSNR
jgi:outer membrane protein TolC